MITISIRLRCDYDTTIPRRIRLRRNGSDRNYDVHSIRLRHDYDPTTTHRARLLPFDAIRREKKINMSIFRRSRIVVESQLRYRLYTQHAKRKVSRQTAEHRRLNSLLTTEQL